MTLTMIIRFELKESIKIFILPNRMLLWIWDVITAVFVPNLKTVIYPLQWKLIGILNQKNPLAERLCKVCNSAVVEDEIHFLIDCELNSDIRYELFHYAHIIHPDFMSLTFGGKLIYLMQNNALQIKLTWSLLLMNRRRRSAANWRIAQTFLTGPDSSVGRVSVPGNGRSRVRSRAAAYQSR